MVTTTSVSEVGQGIDERQYVIVGMGAESYAIDIMAVREIIRMQPITDVPQTHHYVEGLIKLRGTVIPVVEPRNRLGLPLVEASNDTRIVVVVVNNHPVGIIVDAVSEVITVSSHSLEPLGDVLDRHKQVELQGIINLDDRMILVLALDQLVGEIAGFDEIPSLHIVPPSDEADGAEAPQAPAGDGSFCDACSATGTGSNGKPCDACGGSGLTTVQLATTDADAADNAADADSGLCPKCDATGQNKSGGACKACEGTGLAAGSAA